MLSITIYTLVSSSVVSSEDDQIRRVSHRSSSQVVLLHLEPVALPRFVDALKEAGNITG